MRDVIDEWSLNTKVILWKYFFTTFDLSLVFLNVCNYFGLQDVISNLQQILVKTPPALTSNTFVTVLHILVLMSSNGSDVGLLLLREKIGETLKRLLITDKVST